MRVKTRRIELEKFGIPGLECEDEWIEVIPRAALLATVDEEFTDHQKAMSALQRQLLKGPSDEDAEAIRQELEEKSERFVDFVLETQIADWNLADGENSLPLPKDGKEWREALPTGVQLKVFEFLTDLMWGDEPVKPHGEGRAEEVSRAKKGGRRKR